MKAYTVTVRPNADAFAAILRFDPDAVIELETADVDAETYTVNSAFSLDALLDAAPGMIEWDDAPAKELIPAISVMGTLLLDECKFFFDSLTGEPLSAEVFHDFGGSTVEHIAPADVPWEVREQVDRYLAAHTARETGLYGLLLWIDRKVGRFTRATRAMWRVWNWYVARGAQ